MGTYVKNVQTVANVNGGGDTNWSLASPTGGTCTYVSLTNYLVGTNLDGSAIPTDETIVGIRLRIGKSGSGDFANPVDNDIAITKNGTSRIGDNKSVGGDWPGSNTTYTYGGATDLWGLTFTPAEVNASTFGVMIQASGMESIATVSGIEITIYTESGPIEETGSGGGGGGGVADVTVDYNEIGIGGVVTGGAASRFAIYNPIVISAGGTSSITSYASSLAVQTGTGDVGWINTSNILAEDGSYTEIDPGETTKYGARDPFILTQFDGFSALSDSATITGIAITVRAYSSDTHQEVSSVVLRYSGNNYGSFDSSGYLLSTSPSDIVIGDSSDLWGATLTPAIVKDSSFGVYVEFDDPSTSGADLTYVDSVKMTVYFSTPSTPIGGVVTAGLSDLAAYEYGSGGGELAGTASVSLTQSVTGTSFGVLVGGSESSGIIYNEIGSGGVVTNGSGFLSGITNLGTSGGILSGDISGIFAIYNPIVIDSGGATNATSYASSVTIGVTNDVDWINVTNVLAEDGSYAEINPSATPKYGTRDTFRLTQFDFSSVPNDATINGIEVIVRAYSSDTHQEVSSVVLRYSAANYGTADTTGYLLSTSPSDITVGSSSTLWGVTPTPAIIKDSSFGVEVEIDDPNTGGADLTYVDSIKIKIYYTATATPAGGVVISGGSISTYNNTASGGPLNGGLANVQVISSYTASAGIAAAGNGYFYVNYTLDASAGVVAGGSSLFNASNAIIASGGIVSGQSAVVYAIYNPIKYLSDEWTYYKEIRYATDGIPNSNLTDFPKLISITSDSDIAAACASGGGIKFTSADGNTDLSFGLYPQNDITTGDILARVKLSLSATANVGDVLCRIYYDPNKSTVEDKSGTVDNDYVMYMPLEENPGGSAPQMYDWVTESYIGTSNGTMTSGDLVASQVGNGLEFDGTDDDIVISSTFGLSTPATLECIVDLGSASLSGSFLKVGNTLSGYAIGVGATNYDDDGNDLIALYELRRWIDTNTTIGTGKHYVVLTVPSGGTVPSLYLDGTFVNSYSGSAPISPLSETRIGGYTTGGNVRRGNYVVDEPRVSSVARSGDWINYQYTDDFSNSTTFTLSSEVTPTLFNASGMDTNGSISYLFEYYPTISGGSVANGNLDLNQISELTSAGGAVFAGIADVFRSLNLDTSGGVVIAGISDASSSNTYDEESSGGIVTAGVSDLYVIYQVSSQDGTSTNGNVIDNVYNNITGVDGIVIGGIGQVYLINNLIGTSYGVTIAGDATTFNTNIFNETGVGGIVANGSVLDSTLSNETSNGGLLNNGSSDVFLINNITGTSFGSVVAGNANTFQSMIYVETGSGGIVISGVNYNNLINNIGTSSGISSAGTSIVFTIQTEYALGGVVLAGNAEYLNVYTISGNAGILSAGNNDVFTFNNIVGNSNGAVVGSSSLIFLIDNNSGTAGGTGGLVVAGQADIFESLTYDEIGSGGVNLAGISTINSFNNNIGSESGLVVAGVSFTTLDAVSTGGTEVSGLYENNQYHNISGSGGVVAAGSYMFDTYSDGGILASGSAIDEYIYSAKGGVVAAGSIEIHMFDDVSNEISGGIVAGGHGILTYIKFSGSSGGVVVQSDEDSVSIAKLIFNYKTTGLSADAPPDYSGVTVGYLNHQNPTIVNFTFNKDFDLNWRTDRAIELDFNFKWNSGQLRQYFYRIVGKAKYTDECDPIQVGEVCCRRYVMNVHARSITELCQVLKSQRWKWPVESVQRFSRPANQDDIAEDEANGINHDCNKLETVDICSNPICAEFCIDYDLSESWGFDDQVQLNAFFNYTGSGSLILSGNANASYEVDSTWNYTTSGGFTIGGESNYYGPVRARGGALAGGEAFTQSSKWYYTGGQWPLEKLKIPTANDFFVEEVGNRVWTNPEYAYVSDSNYAVSNINQSQPTGYLVLKNFNLNIPSGNRIIGIEVSIERHATISAKDDGIYLVVGDEIVSDDMSSSNNWPIGIDSTAIYGGIGNVWRDPYLDDYLGEWDLDDINNSNFGVAIKVRPNIGHLTAEARVNSVNIKILYESEISSHLSLSGEALAKGPNYHYVSDNLSGIVRLGGGYSSLERSYKFRSTGKGSMGPDFAGVTISGTYGITHRYIGSGSISIGGEAEIWPGGLTSGGEAHVTSTRYYYTSQGEISLGSANLTKVYRSYIADITPLIISGIAGVNNNFVTEGSGDVSISGEARVRSSNYKWTSEGGIDISGDASYKFGNLGTIDFDIGYDDSIDSFSIIYSAESVDSLGNSDDLVNQCGCTNMDLVIPFTHNLNSNNKLSQFLSRNSLSMSSFQEMHYSDINKNWYQNIKFSGLSVGGSYNESWDLLFSIGCISNIAENTLDDNIWRFSLQIIQRNVTLATDYDFRLLVGFKPELVCEDGFRVFIDINTQTKSVLLSPEATIYEFKIFDNINLFNNYYWIQNPLLKFEFSQVGLNTPLSRQTVIYTA